MKLGRSSFWVLSALGCVVLAGTASATTITGTANIAGSVTVSATSIQFAPTFTAFGTNNGSFTGITGGTIGSLTAGPGQALVGAVNDPNFITFTGGIAPSPVNFDLTFIVPGDGTAAGCTGVLGVSCTPTGSPFTLVQESNGVLATLDFTGLGYTGTSASGSSLTTSVFSTQIVFAGATVPGILQTLGTGGSIVGQSYSATFTATNTPEPASIMLMGLGVVGAGLIGRRKIAVKA